MTRKSHPYWIARYGKPALSCRTLRTIRPKLIHREAYVEVIMKGLARFMEPEFLTNHLEFLLVLVFAYSFMEVVFPPIPGDTLLIFSGSLAGIANLSPAWMILCASLGTFCASFLLYQLGFKMERRVLATPKLSWLLDSHTFIKLEKWFHRYGFLTLLASRFLPVARSGMILTAGIVNLDRKKSLLAVSVSIVLSSTFFVLGGFFLGRRWKLVLEFWQSQYKLIIFGVVCLAVGMLLLRIFRRQHKTE